MNSILPISKLYRAFFVFALIAGLQISSQAQLTVFNNTGCTIFISQGQSDNTTVVPCDICPVIGGLTQILPGNTATFAPNAVCGPQQWYGVRWILNFAGPVGYTLNPILGGGCGADVPGAGCGGALVTTANWIISGAGGAAFVVIQ